MANKQVKAKSVNDATNKERQLVDAAKAGDRKALEALVKRHEARVYRFGRHMCRDSHDAEEVQQETFLAMTRSLADYRGAASLSTWLYSIARSFCIKKRRRSKFAPEYIESLEGEGDGASLAVADPGRPPDEAVAAAQLKGALDRAIATLRPMYREVLVLRDIEGLTAPEVSESLGITVQAVKSRLHRAREQVRELVMPQLEQAELPPPTSERCERTARLFSRHLEGEIDAATCASMEQHVHDCAHCGAVCSSLRETLATCRQIGAERTEVPPALQKAVRQAIKQYVGHI